MGLPAHTADATRALLARHPAAHPAAGWVNIARRDAEQRLRAMGAPHGRDEYWRYTPPARLLAEDVAANIVQDAPRIDLSRAHNLVFVDGVFDAAQSTIHADDHLQIEALAQVTEADIHWAAPYFGALEMAAQTPVARPFAALNTARATQGIVLRATGVVDRPVNIRYDRREAGADVMLHHVVRVDAGAAVTVLEYGVPGARSNIVMEISIADDARFDHIRNQGRDHERLMVSHIFAELGARSRFKSFTLALNGRLTRNEAVITLSGNDASAHIAGAAVGDKEFLHDDTIFITHAAENCESRQVFKKVLKNGATGVFQGKILVKQGAQKTDGYQISQGLLLDDDSNFLAKPELEIYADDVVCSHGSTCGSVDETALFYLTSRGVPRATAQDLLVLAFLEEAISEIGDEGLAATLRDRLHGWLERHRA